MPTEAIRPAYGGACVNGIVPALLGQADRSWLPRAARDARAVILLVLDGLGWRIIERNRELLPVLSSFDGGPITTVVPSTTPAVLTSITTSLAPSEHGITGFRMFTGNGVLNVLRWEMENGDPPPDPELMQPHPAFGGRRNIPVVTKSEFRFGGFTRAHLGGARFEGWATPSMIVERCRRIASSSDEFGYAYYAGPDLIAHLRGLDDGFFSAELTFTDALVGALLDALPSDVTLLVTADHGQVPFTKESWIDLEDIEGIDCFSGDARLRFAHTRAGAAADVEAAVKDRTTGRAWIFQREQFLDEGWMGPSPKPEVVARIGDVVLAANEPIAFIDPALPQEVRLRTGHGSMTEDEMLVPLLAARGRR